MSFPSQSLNNTVINSFLQKLSTWVTAKSNISTRIDFLLLTSVTFLRAITMCNAFTPDCGYNNSTVFLIGDVYCRNTTCLGKLCLHKKKLSSSRQKRLSMPATRICVPGAEYSFWRSNNFLFLVAWSRRLQFWRESKINSRCLWRRVLSRWVLSQQRKMQIYWWLCNNSEIHFCWWQLWSLVVCPQSSFHVTRERKDDKNSQNTLFLC